MKNKKKIINLSLCFILFLIVGLTSILLDYLQSNTKLDTVALKDIKTNSNLAIMIWDDTEEDYVKYTGNATFPSRSDYVYMKDESGCINISDQKVPNSLVYDTKNSRATVTTKETVKCFLYFKKGISLTINKGEGIDKIYFKANEMEEYEESSSNITLKVLPNSSYSYYGTTIDNTYVLNECKESSPCEKTMSDTEKVETIGAIKQLYLTITKDAKIETIKYKKEGESIYSTYSTQIPVEENSKYYYYGDVSSTYSNDYGSLCTESSPCSVSVGTTTTTGNVGVCSKVLSEYVMCLSNKEGTNVITQTTDATDQTGNNATIDYRYIGPSDSVNNYVKLEHTGGTYELYRIIGVFKTSKIVSGSATSTYELRVKLIKADYYGDKYYWSGSNSNQSNNYNNSTLLNSSGELNTTYWNTLSSTTQGLIDPVVWHLGGVGDTSDDTSVPTWFNTERSNSARYENNPKSAINKIGLMYPSDYGYATNGGTLGRKTCLDSDHQLHKWNNYSECYNNSWLYLGSIEWTISPLSRGGSYSWYVGDIGIVSYASTVGKRKVRPVFYLKSNVKLVGNHTGSSTDPYEVEL